MCYFFNEGTFEIFPFKCLYFCVSPEPVIALAAPIYFLFFDQKQMRVLQLQPCGLWHSALFLQEKQNLDSSSVRVIQINWEERPKLKTQQC